MKQFTLTIAALVSLSSVSYGFCLKQFARTNSNRFTEYASKKDNYVASIKHIDNDAAESTKVRRQK